MSATPRDRVEVLTGMLARVVPPPVGGGGWAVRHLQRDEICEGGAADARKRRTFVPVDKETGRLVFRSCVIGAYLLVRISARTK